MGLFRWTVCFVSNRVQLLLRAGYKKSCKNIPAFNLMETESSTVKGMVFEVRNLGWLHSIQLNV